MIFRCPDCRTRRSTFVGMLNHLAKSGHKACGCGGYHFKHRPFSTYCEKNPQSPVHHARRAGAGDEELATMAAEIAWEIPGRGGNRCPF